MGCSHKDKTLKEKILYYQTLLRVQKQVACVRKNIQTWKKILHERGVEYGASDQSTLSVIRKPNSVLLNMKKQMAEVEVYREMYGSYVRYKQSFLKGQKCGKKTIDNHIKNNEFIMKMINWGAKELKEFVFNLTPNFEESVKNLEIFGEIDV